MGEQQDSHLHSLPSNVRDVGVAGLNPVTPTIDFWGTMPALGVGFKSAPVQIWCEFRRPNSRTGRLLTQGFLVRHFIFAWSSRRSLCAGLKVDWELRFPS